MTSYLDRAYRYRIEGSPDSATWTVLVDRTQNPAPGTQLDSFTAVTTRYVRLVVTGVSGSSTSWVSIQEFGVYPTAASTTPPPATLAADTFERTITSGLGSAEIGGQWSLSGGAAAFSVSGGSARLSLAAGAGRSAYLNSVSTATVDLAVTCGPTAAPRGGPAYFALIARRVGTSDLRLKVKRPVSGVGTASLVRSIGGAETVLATVQLPTGIGVTDLVRLRVRATTSGATTTVSARAWKAGASEPGTWLLTARRLHRCPPGSGQHRVVGLSLRRCHQRTRCRHLRRPQRCGPRGQPLTARASASARSVRSQVMMSSSRPKWP